MQCHVRVRRGTDHVQHVIAGFTALARAGEIDLTMSIDRADTPDSYPYIIQADVDGRRITYDLQDGVLRPDSPVNVSLLQRADVFYARSYLPGSYGEFEAKVRPLGLTMAAFARTPTGVRISGATVKDIARKWLSPSTRLHPASYYERPPQAGDGPVVFFARLWEPCRHPGDIAAINATRVSVLRELQARFGSRLHGGIIPTAYAREHHPDLLATKAATTKAAYTKTVGAAAVVVTTAGIENSNGWKLAEAVAASKAIVAERMAYTVPGAFRAGGNYLEFTDAESCADQVQRLMEDDCLAVGMSHANAAYYRSHVQPASLVGRTLR